MADNHLRSALTRIGVLTARPAAFVIVGIFTLIWLIFDRASLDIHGVATLATWMMTLFIQRATHRDTQAIQAKLDELIRSHGPASNALAGVDDREPEDIEAMRAAPSS